MTLVDIYGRVEDMISAVDVKPAKAPTPGLYRQDDGTVILVKLTKRKTWYAVGLRRRPDFSLERTYLGHRTKGLHPSNALTLDEATDWLVG